MCEFEQMLFLDKTHLLCIKYTYVREEYNTIQYNTIQYCIEL